MAHLFLIPDWFFGYNVILEFFFAITALAVALYSFKVYRLSNQEQPRLFGIAFLLFSISYFIQSILNYLIITNAAQAICDCISIPSLFLFNAIGIYVHMFFFVIGLVTLAYMTLKTKNITTYVLLLSTLLLSFFVVENKIPWFYMISSLLLVFISLHYLFNFIKNKRTKTLLVFIAFMLLLFGHTHFIFSVNHTLYYVLGHFLELFAYILILINLLLVIKNGKKKK
jgi:hypothetical protein